MSYDDPLDSLVNDPVGTVTRLAQAAVSGRIGELERRLNETSVEAGKQRTMSILDADPEIGGKWRKLNNDQAFLAWCDEIDGFSGAPRLELLRRAFNAGNAARVALIFKSYIASQRPARERTAERLPHETGARQPTVRPSNGVHEERRRIWAKGEIRQFYSDVRRGVYDKRESERLQIEQEIFKAAKENRVADNAVQPKNRGSPF
jgi:hypothetical protein